jgi:hypothetical protein
VEYQVVERGARDYPARLAERLGKDAPARLYVHGPLELLQRVTMAVICSDSISGVGMMAANQLLFTIREYDLNYIGGWHSIMETEIFRLGLWRYNHTVTLFSAKGLEKETFESFLLDRFYPPMDKFPEKSEYFRRAEVDDLLVLSVAEPGVTRTLRANVVYRNLVACALGDFTFVPFAQKGTKTYALARKVKKAGWPVFTVDDKLASDVHELGIVGLNRRSVAGFIEGLGAQRTRMVRKTIAEGPKEELPSETEAPVTARTTQGVLPFASDKPRQRKLRRT